MLAACFHVGFFLGLLSDPEDEGDLFLRKIYWLSTNNTALSASYPMDTGVSFLGGKAVEA
jgi:hypothetical protein